MNTIMNRKQCKVLPSHDNSKNLVDDSVSFFQDNIKDKRNNFEYNISEDSRCKFVTGICENRDFRQFNRR